MSYTQKTLIKNVKPIDVVRCFHSYKFIQFLTLGQPVKIKSWIGIDNNKKATDIMASQGMDKAIRHMFLHPETGEPMDYATMRSFYG